MIHMYVMYSKSPCQYCDSARALFKMRGIEYNEYKLGKDFSRDELLEWFPQAKTFPVIVKEGKFIGGFTELKESLG